jgi:hypothetical protein
MPDAAEKEKNVDSSREAEVEIKRLKQELRLKSEEAGQLRGNLTKVMKKNEKLTTQLVQKTSSSAPKDETAPKDAQPASSTTITPANPIVTGPDTSKPQAESETHVAKWEPPYCPDCGGANESFKNQVKCASCGAPLGSEEYAKHTMKVCPLCGTASGWKPVGDYQPVHTGCTGPECKLIQVKA